MLQNGDKDSIFSCKQGIRCGSQLITLDRPIVMGILNITPDSFYDGGKHTTPSGWINHTHKMISEGARIVDIGVVSTRPGAREVSESDETNWLIPALKVLVKEFPAVIFSVDTWRSSVGRQAIDQGASIVNDISGGTFDPGMIPWIGASRIPYIVMHIQGTPADMQKDPVYEDVVSDVLGFFARQTSMLTAAGATDIMIDPGFGFGKTIAHNYRLLKELPVLTSLGFPIVAGISRKSMIYKLIGSKPDDALNATTAAHVLALLGGARILRVHDVKEATEAIAVWHAWYRASL